MSYANYDHADWMRSEIAARKRTQPKAFANAPDELSEFQAKVIDIIGIINGGIYNGQLAKRINWNWGGGVSVLWHGSLSTWDFDGLTKLVFLCHEARIRCELRAVNPQYVRLNFHPRDDGKSYADGHPNLDEAVASFREYLPKDHRIRYRRQP